MLHQKPITGAFARPTLTATVRAALMFGLLAGAAGTATAAPRVDPSLISGSLQIVAGGPLSAARLGAPVAVTVAPDGGLYIVDAGHSVVRRVAADGTISTIAGTGTAGRSPDGQQAAFSQLAYPTGIAVAQDGTVYVADTDSHRIRYVRPDGVLSTIAGTDGPGYGGDGGPATNALLAFPEAVATAPDGVLYVADTSNHRVRRVGPNGMIATIAGTGAAGYSGDGDVATQAQLNSPSGLAVGRDGTLYVADSGNWVVRRVAIDGTIATVAGDGDLGVDGDGGPATRARLAGPFGLAVAPDGALYVADAHNDRIRRVGPEGTITTVLGGARRKGVGSSASGTGLVSPYGVALAHDGRLFVADTGNARVLATAYPLAG